MAIMAYEPNATDFTTNGLGVLHPESCIVEETANGGYEAILKHPITLLFRLFRQIRKWRMLDNDVILSIPVPVRTMPEIIDVEGSPGIVTLLERWKVAADKTTVRQQASSSSKALRTLAKDAEWIVTLKNGAWYKGRDAKGRDGWVLGTTLEYVEDIVTPNNTGGIETAIPASFSSQQYFRIYRVSWTDDEVTAYARHITYDFGKNMLAECNFSFVDGYTALRVLKSNLYMPAGDFQCYTDISATPESTEDRQRIQWTRINPIKALLDPDIGFCNLYNAECVRDNYSLYFLKQAGLDRGFTIGYGKNMTGIVWEEDKDDVITRILPIGQTNEGMPLLLPEVFVDSPHINDYPLVYIGDPLDVPDAAVGSEKEDGTKITLSMAYEMMRAAAQKEFSYGVDIPTVTLSVNFINLGDTAEFAEYKNLEQLFLHDVIRIWHKKLELFVKARVIKTTWDAVLQRYTAIEISTKGFDVSASRIASWQIPSGIDGSKVRGGTIGSSQLSSSVTASYTTNIQSYLTGMTFNAASGHKATVTKYNGWAYIEIYGVKTAAMTAGASFVLGTGVADSQIFLPSVPTAVLGFTPSVAASSSYVKLNPTTDTAMEIRLHAVAAIAANAAVSYAGWYKLKNA